MDESSVAGKPTYVGGRGEFVQFFSVWADQRPSACPRWKEHRLMIPLGTRYFYRVTSWVHLLRTSCSVVS